MPQLLDDDDVADAIRGIGVQQVPLSTIEARLVLLAKAEADRALQAELALVIQAHGFNPNDGQKYNFVEDQGKLVLQISR